jgi:hypothetical protein
MMPVSSLAQVHISWLVIQRQGYKVYGFLLYSDLDRALTSFMQNGLIELDMLSGEKCAIFIIESPSKKWLDHVRRRSHPWNEVAGFSALKQTNYQDKNTTRKKKHKLDDFIIDDAYQLVLSRPNKEPIVLSHLLNPDFNISFDRSEVWEVAKHFDIKPNKVPCIVFFYDI